MRIDDLLNNELSNPRYVSSSNILNELQKLLENVLKNPNRIEREENIDQREYNVFSHVEGREYAILSFEEDGQKLIKVPIEQLPHGINSRSVLRKEKDYFYINQEKTQENEQRWEKEQKMEQEGRVYMVNGFYNDYVTGIDIQNGKETKIDDFLGINVRKKLKLGDFITMKDSKFCKYEDEIIYPNIEMQKQIEEKMKILKETNIEKDEIEEDIDTEIYESEKEISYIMNYNNEIRPEQGDICAVTKFLGNTIELENIENRNIFWLKKDPKEDIIVGDFVQIQEDNQYKKYEGEIQIENERVERDLRLLYDWII